MMLLRNDEHPAAGKTCVNHVYPSKIYMIPKYDMIILQ